MLSVKSNATIKMSNKMVNEDVDIPPSGDRHVADNRLEQQTLDVERLGRERPARFKSIWAELGFCYSVIASMFMAVSRVQPPQS